MLNFARNLATSVVLIYFMQKSFRTFISFLIVLVLSGFRNVAPIVKPIPKSNLVIDVLDYKAAAPSFESSSFMIPFTGNNYVGFKEALAFKESQGKYHSINTLGYLGKYQFGKSTLAFFGQFNTQCFMQDAALQEKIFYHNTARNKWILRRDIKRYVGSKMNDIVITESGILAAAHLAGAGNVKKYLRSWGDFNFSDAYGTDIEDYLTKFSGFDLAEVTARKKVQFQ